MHIKQRFPVGNALNVSTQVHTAPAMFGKIMAEIKPRMAVGYQTFNDWDTQPQILKEIRKTYDGPVEVATDYMVFNVTKDDVKIRMAAVDEDIWPLPSTTEKKLANPEDRVGFSEEVMGSCVVLIRRGVACTIAFRYLRDNGAFVPSSASRIWAGGNDITVHVESFDYKKQL